MRHYEFRERRPMRARWYQRINLNPAISQGLLAILLLVASGLAVLSFFELAGVAGQFINALLSVAFGTVRFAFPILLLVIAALIVRDADYDYRPTHFIGAILFFLGLNGFMHLPFAPADMLTNAQLGQGGGLIGFASAWPLKTYTGYWGSVLVLVALFLASIIFLFNTSLARIVALHKSFFVLLGWLGRGIVNFFTAFKREGDKVQFKIKGEYDVAEAENDEQEADEAPAFAHRSLAKHAAAAAEEAPEEPVPETSGIILEKPSRQYKLPPLDLLYTSKSKPTSGDIKHNADVIKDTLHHFGIEVEMGEVRVGPTVTQYSLKPFQGTKLSRITALSNDLALALAAHPIRIEAPIPGKSLVGIEVPNQRVALVTLRELLESPEFNRREHNLYLAIGKDVAGKVWVADLPKMPHLLVAGATGSGKTVCINTILLSLLFQNTPETLRLILVDPKRVELTLYNGIPHLLTPVITDAGKTVNALKWTIGEMERRFDALAAAGARDLASYNKTEPEPMPHIVLVIDELADLMAAAASEVEAGIIRLAQMARAVGIHLIVATQRPSVDIITGLMKANITTRLAFAVTSIMDSRTILDCPGAEKLLGRGDMLFLTADLSKPKRLQGAFVSEEEMKEITNFLRGDEPPEYDDTIVSKGAAAAGTINMFGGPADDQDPLFAEARRIVVESGKASASLLQRRLKLGYARAARLLDEMEEAGIVGPADGAKPREVFTEYLSPSAPSASLSAELPEEEQTVDAGGIVLDEPTEIRN